MSNCTELTTNPTFQIARWRHAADWWSGKIAQHIADRERARIAVDQVLIWTEKLAYGAAS